MPLVRKTPVEELTVGDEIIHNGVETLIVDIRRIAEKCYALDVYTLGEETKYMRPGQLADRITRKVREWLPGDFSEGEFAGARVCDLLDRKVLKKHYTWRDGHGWPGRHRNVVSWVEIEGGLAVGFNENPSVGWGFPVIKWPR